MNERTGFSSSQASSVEPLTGAVRNAVEEGTGTRGTRPSIAEQSRLSDALRSELTDKVGRIRQGLRSHPVLGGLIAAGVLLTAAAVVGARRRMH